MGVFWTSSPASSPGHTGPSPSSVDCCLAVNPPTHVPSVFRIGCQARNWPHPYIYIRKKTQNLTHHLALPVCLACGSCLFACIACHVRADIGIRSAIWQSYRGLCTASLQECLVIKNSDDVCVSLDLGCCEIPCVQGIVRKGG